MTMMLAKNGRSCFIKEARKQQIMGLGGRKDTPRCRPIAAGKIQSSLFGFSALWQQGAIILTPIYSDWVRLILDLFKCSHISLTGKKECDGDAHHRRPQVAKRNLYTLEIMKSTLTTYFSHQIHDILQLWEGIATDILLFQARSKICVLGLCLSSSTSAFRARIKSCSPF